MGLEALGTCLVEIHGKGERGQKGVCNAETEINSGHQPQKRGKEWKKGRDFDAPPKSMKAHTCVGQLFSANGSCLCKQNASFVVTKTGCTHVIWSGVVVNFKGPAAPETLLRPHE
jgi:hypothetical protein